jgi:hypothetical protein
MPISSTLELEPGFGNGKGHPTPKGNAYGLQKQAMADGHYTLDITGIDATNHTAVDQISAPVTIADGSRLNTEVRAGSITIDAVSTGGDAALHLITDSADGRLRVNDAFTADQQVKLGELNQLSFEYKVVSSDRTDITPVIRITVDADGNLATTNDRGELVFEYAYQGQGPVPSGWQQVDLTTWNAWQRSNGANHDSDPDIVPISTWGSAAGHTANGGIHFDQNSVIVGWSIALGSGNGTTEAYVDHLQVGKVSYDFA